LLQEINKRKQNKNEGNNGHNRFRWILSTNQAAHNTNKPARTTSTNPTANHFKRSWTVNTLPTSSNPTDNTTPQSSAKNKAKTTTTDTRNPAEDSPQMYNLIGRHRRRNSFMRRDMGGRSMRIKGGLLCDNRISRIFMLRIRRIRTISFRCLRRNGCSLKKKIYSRWRLAISTRKVNMLSIVGI